MSLLRLAATTIALAMLVVPTVAQQDAIGIEGPISYDGTQFGLAWTSHPTDAYYKQEYLPKGQTVDRYEQMFMVDVLTEGNTPQGAAEGMIVGLDERKANDPVVNYDIIANKATGELVLDFLVSDASSGEMIVEWNAYRYVPYGDGFALYAISRRGYGDGATDFIAGLKDWRPAAIEALASMDLPPITLKKPL